jgi:dolichol-phosphate mannosyltransferase
MMSFKINDRVAVVIPCYKVKRHILDVISQVPENVERIYTVDDNCPENTGDLIEKECTDKRVKVLRNSINRGVGGAMMYGYQVAIDDGMTILVKIDGDGQMNPSFIDMFVQPILAGRADYVKGNRFFDLETVRQMPKMRLVGNAGLSFISKFSTGYWDIFDPTNGYTAIHSKVADLIPFNKISERYFFETDILFRLNTIRAVVLDLPMVAQYGNEKSNLKISKVALEFGLKHIKNTAKRVLYNYWLRNFSVASIQLFLGLCLLLFGSSFGVLSWYEAASKNILSPVGTVMIAAMSILVGLQFILAFLAYDMNSVPSEPLHPHLNSKLKNSLDTHGE